MGRRKPRKYETIEDNPHLPKPVESWLNERLASRIASDLLRSLSYDATYRLKRYLEWPDIVQEVLLKMAESAIHYDRSKGALTTYMYAVCRRHLQRVSREQSLIRVPASDHRSDYAAQAKRTRHVLGDSGIRDDDGGVFSLESYLQCDDDDEIRHLIESLGELPESDRDILHEWYFDGRLLRDIGQIRGVSGEWRLRQLMGV